MSDSTGLPTGTQPAGDTLERRLGLWSAVAIVIGITIGSGIFRTPAVIARRVPDPTLMLGLWMLGGLMTLAGALSFAELGAAFPRAGGPYVYLREGWGRPAGFLFGWARLVMIGAASIGAIATVFSEYFLRSFGYDPLAHPRAADYVAVAAVLFATGVNVVGVRLGAAIIGLSTMAKYLGLAAIVLAAFLLGGDHGASGSHFRQAAGEVSPALFGLALISVLWACDGFADLSFASGEVANPQRNLPRALILGTLAVMVIYALANVAYLYVTPVERMAASDLIAADTMGALFGHAGEVLVSVLVMISTFGTLNGIMLSGPRIFFAMAEDGLFFRRIAAVHPRFGTPYVAVMLAGTLGAAMILTQTFEQLTDTFVLATWLFHALTGAAIYRLRRTRPDLPRPYKVIGYPYVPGVFILAATYVVANAVWAEPLWTSIVFGVVLAGVPVYYLGFRSRQEIVH